MTSTVGVITCMSRSRSRNVYKSKAILHPMYAQPAEILYLNSTHLLHLTIQRVLLHYSILKKTRGGIR